MFYHDIILYGIRCIIESLLVSVAVITFAFMIFFIIFIDTVVTMHVAVAKSNTGQVTPCGKRSSMCSVDACAICWIGIQNQTTVVVMTGVRYWCGIFIMCNLSYL